MGDLNTGGNKVQRAAVQMGATGTSKGGPVGKGSLFGTTTTVNDTAKSALTFATSQQPPPTLSTRTLETATMMVVDPSQDPSQMTDEIAATKQAMAETQGADDVGKGGDSKGDVEEKQTKEDEAKGKEQSREAKGDMVVSDADGIAQSRKREYNAFEQAMKNLFAMKGEVGERPTNVDDYIKIAKGKRKGEGFEDITEIHAAYDLLLKKIKQGEITDIDEESLKNLESNAAWAKEQIFTENKSAIIAGWNIKATHSELERYRLAVQKQKNMPDRFMAMVSDNNPEHSKEKALKNIEMMLKFISQDQKAFQSSLDSGLLASINDEIKQAQQCVTVMETVTNLINYVMSKRELPNNP